MMYLILKTMLSALLITIISEVSKKSSLIGAILASLPLVSFISIIWLYIDSKSVEKVSQLSTSIFWLVIPSLSLFILLPLFLRLRINFSLALFAATIIMIIVYFALLLILNKFGIKL